ncbi:MAG: hypothetical protein ACOX5F_04950 [Anaerovoracaceae bacterium]|jgi:hypothetical protein
MNNRFMGITFGLGLASGLLGSYMLMSPKNQRNMQQNLSKAVDDLTNIIDDISDGLQSFK